MKKYKLFLASLFIVLLAACSNNDKERRGMWILDDVSFGDTYEELKQKSVFTEYDSSNEWCFHPVIISGLSFETPDMSDTCKFIQIYFEDERVDAVHLYAAFEGYTHDYYGGTKTVDYMPQEARELFQMLKTAIIAHYGQPDIDFGVGRYEWERKGVRFVVAIEAEKPQKIVVHYGAERKKEENEYRIPPFWGKINMEMPLNN